MKEYTSLWEKKSTFKSTFLTLTTTTIMNVYAEQTSERKETFSDQETAQKSTQKEATFQFVNNRSNGEKFEDYQSKANNSPRINKVTQLQSKANDFVENKNPVIQKKENNTGLPDNLKSGMESLSGISLDDVKVHRNSDKPAQLQAHAYAQGTDIHLGRGQEKHLPHEAWHVVQQKQGRVKPTKQLKSKTAINDDDVLEREAGSMGTKALQMRSIDYVNTDKMNTSLNTSNLPVQRKVMVKGEYYDKGIEAKYSSKMKEAMSDEYIRHYESNEEAEGHIEQNKAGNFGLIKSRALWYRIPFLNDKFFVFGEYHSAVKGRDIKASSNTSKPILDESKGGWRVNQIENQSLSDSVDSGLDEDSSKLLRALEMWCGVIYRQHNQQPQLQVGGGDSLPKIPDGKSSVREQKGGTQRLIVYGEEGEEEYWKPTEAKEATKNTYNFEAEMLNAIRNIFESLFNYEIVDEFDEYEDGEEILKAWGYFKNKTWEGKQNAYKIKNYVVTYLHKAAREKVTQEFNLLRETEHSEKIRKGDHSEWGADNYRDEFMLARILEGKKAGTFAFANIGNDHLKNLGSRLWHENISYILADHFYKYYCTNAIDTDSIAIKNSPVYRKARRMKIWLHCAQQKYPNLKESDLGSFNYTDFGEFINKGKITKWEQNQQSNPSQGLNFQNNIFQVFLTDIQRVYPNSIENFNKLEDKDIGEFFKTELINKWE